MLKEEAEEGGEPLAQPSSASLLCPQSGTEEPFGRAERPLGVGLLPSVAGTSQLPPLECSAVNKGLSTFSDRLWIWLGFCLGFQRQEAVKSLGRMN